MNRKKQLYKSQKCFIEIQTLLNLRIKQECKSWDLQNRKFEIKSELKARSKKTSTVAAISAFPKPALEVLEILKFPSTNS